MKPSGAILTEESRTIKSELIALWQEEDEKDAEYFKVYFGDFGIGMEKLNKRRFNLPSHVVIAVIGAAFNDSATKGTHHHTMGWTGTVHWSFE